MRLHDNKVLIHATESGPVLLLYILEPDLWSESDMSFRQYIFLKNALESFSQCLRSRGLSLVIKVGDAVDVFNRLNNSNKKLKIWSYQETWNNWTFVRDLRVKKWAEENNICWNEFQRNGVVRGLINRDGWSSRWYGEMKKPLLRLPKHAKSFSEKSDIIPDARNIGLTFDGMSAVQNASREEAKRILNKFLYYNGMKYSREMSSPLTAYDSCSRLSVFIAFGVLSVREVFQAVANRRVELQSLEPRLRVGWDKSLRAFESRLRWHCHFIQKLEDEPRVEFDNIHPAFNNLRNQGFNEEKFMAWKQGNTGFPMVDACMKALIATGWLNFRMRAMLTSFASYHLWLHWRRPSLWLAKLFVDYEPGIHYAQIQMQSGTSGINSIRIYNPIKQGLDHDPDGHFVRSWVPELEAVPKEYIHTPWNYTSFKSKYPDPIIEEGAARKFAAKTIYEIRKGEKFKEEAQHIFKKHGSRKRPSISGRTIRKSLPEKKLQGELPL